MHHELTVWLLPLHSTDHESLGFLLEQFWQRKPKSYRSSWMQIERKTGILRASTNYYHTSASDLTYFTQKRNSLLKPKLLANFFPVPGAIHPKPQYINFGYHPSNKYWALQQNPSFTLSFWKSYFLTFEQGNREHRWRTNSNSIPTRTLK
jgi:hypothetical protein